MENIALQYNYYALLAAVLNTKMTIEDAINYFSPATEKHKKNVHKGEKEK